MFVGTTPWWLKCVANNTKTTHSERVLLGVFNYDDHCTISIMAKTMVRYDGLQRRETYDEILGYLERGGGAGINIAFPNRQSSFIRN